MPKSKAEAKNKSNETEETKQPKAKKAGAVALRVVESSRFRSTTSKKKRRRAASKNTAEPVFFRRCHHCDTTNEQNSEILHCGHCEKKLSQFYYFDLSQVRPATDDQLNDESYESEYRPIRGIALRW